MKIVRMDTGIVKVILSDKDLMDMNISMENLTPESAWFGEFMTKIAELVQKETGFPAEKGLMIYDAEKQGDGIVIVLSAGKKRRGCVKIKAVRTCGEKEHAIFFFDSFGVLLSFLKNLSYEKIAHMRLYRYREKLCIVIEQSRVPKLIYEYSFYGQKSKLGESIISEYGELLCDGLGLIRILSETD